MNRILPALFVLLFFVTGCASRAERMALRQCAFSPRSTRMLSNGGDSMIVSVGLEIRNPGPTNAVLDSFLGTASASKPLGHFSHGLLRTIPAGKTDTVDIRFAMANKDLMATAFTFMVSPPDSIGIEGTAWVPNFFGIWTSEQKFKTKLPYKAIAGNLQGLFRGAPPLPSQQAPTP